MYQYAFTVSLAFGKIASVITHAFMTHFEGSQADMWNHEQALAGNSQVPAADRACLKGHDRPSQYRLSSI